MSAPRGADLHSHSHFSDGTFAPAEVVGLAVQLHLEALALTDHDTVAGLAEARSEADRLGILFVPGIELTAHHRGRERHLLAYWAEPAHPELARLLARMARQRRRRITRIVEKLAGCGVRLDPEAVLEVPHRGVLGRLHVAEALRREGLTGSIQEGFDRYLSDSGPAYVPKYALSVTQTIALVHRAGGVAVLAHPGEEPDPAEIRTFAEAGLDGLEAHYPGHPPDLRRHYSELARRWGLVAIGGSDFHGERKPRALGSVTVPLEVVEALKRAAPSPSAAS